MQTTTTTTSIRASAASAPHMLMHPDGHGGYYCCIIRTLQAWLDEQRRPSPLQLFVVRSEYAKKND